MSFKVAIGSAAALMEDGSCDKCNDYNIERGGNVQVYNHDRGVRVLVVIRVISCRAATHPKGGHSEVAHHLWISYFKIKIF